VSLKPLGATAAARPDAPPPNAPWAPDRCVRPSLSLMTILFEPLAARPSVTFPRTGSHYLHSDRHLWV